MRRPRPLALLALGALAAPIGAAAQGIDLARGGPVAITARGGFEWRQQQHEVIATGDARAVRDDVTVLADQLVALYRKKAGGPPAAVAPPAGQAIGGDTGGTEVYRLEATGHVRILTRTDTATADRAVYDIDQAVLVMTGHDLRLTTPQQVLTARDSMEYWSDRHMAVGRGHAVVVTADGRRLAADVLVAYTKPAAAPDARKPDAAQPAGAAQSSIEAAASGTLDRVEAFGNVELRTASGDLVRGDRGVYAAASGLARLVGHVRITHGQNQLNGPAADVNMKTGIAHLISDPGQQVEGLIMPNDATAATGGGTKK
ncbi:MAG: hypothetical protein KGQ40_12640 [Rhodospirillales bacterium]|nr:hypothetical protein [Rhodospirillales bacterium]